MRATMGVMDNESAPHYPALPEMGVPGWMPELKRYIDWADMHRSQRIPLVLHGGATTREGETIAVIHNANGSATLDGRFILHGPLDGNNFPIMFTTLPEEWVPLDTPQYAATGFLLGPARAVHVQIGFNPPGSGGGVFVESVDVPEGAELTVSLHSVTFWPAQ